MTSNDDTRPTRKSRPGWLRFTLRSLMVLVLVSGLGFGWLAHQILQTRQEREAARRIEQLGGRVFYEQETNGKVRAGLGLLGKLLGENLAVDARYVHLDGVEVPDAALEPLRLLTQVRWLDVSNTQISDDGLLQLRGLTQLRELLVNNTQVTDDGLRHLRRLTNLEHLELNHTPVTGMGLRYLNSLHELSEIHLSETRVTDSELVHLHALVALRVLDLSATSVTDAGLAHLWQLGDLQFVNLAHTHVTEVGVNKLQQALPDLNILADHHVSTVPSEVTSQGSGLPPGEAAPF